MKHSIGSPFTSAKILVSIWLLCFSAACRQSTQSDFVPGTIIAHSPARSEIYLGSPSIVILTNGNYLASHDLFGPNTTNNITRIYRSTNRGEDWQNIAELQGQFWSSLFCHRGVVYLFGTSGQNGSCIIRRSDDGGVNWTVPDDASSGLILNDGEFHTAPMPFLVFGGRIWRAMEDRYPPEGWGTNLRSFVLSAPVDADLLKSDSWSQTNRLRYDPAWSGNAWLEGNVVLSPDKRILNILRNDYRPQGGRACVISISDDGTCASFDTTTGFIDFPGGCKKFSIRFDSTSNRYRSLSNFIPKEYKGGNPERTRNTLALISSEDLKTWSVDRIVLQHPDVEYVGFQYADWQIDGDDIVAAIRTAYPESDGTNAHNCHDANYVIFYRIKNFRENTVLNSSNRQ